jgi:hypothetical protein
MVGRSRIIAGLAVVTPFPLGFVGLVELVDGRGRDASMNREVRLASVRRRPTAPALRFDGPVWLPACMQLFKRLTGSRYAHRQFGGLPVTPLCSSRLAVLPKGARDAYIRGT